MILITNIEYKEVAGTAGEFFELSPRDTPYTQMETHNGLDYQSTNKLQLEFTRGRRFQHVTPKLDERTGKQVRNSDGTLAYDHYHVVIALEPEPARLLKLQYDSFDQMKINNDLLEADVMRLGRKLVSLNAELESTWCYKIKRFVLRKFFT